MWDFRNDSEFFDYHECLWQLFKNDIVKVVIKDGVEYIGTDAFAECANLSDVQMADSVKDIGCFAFFSAESFRRSSFAKGLKQSGNKLSAERG